MALASAAVCGSNSYSQLLLSTNYGVTWSTTTTGLPNICNGYWKVVYSQDNNNMYAIPVVVVGKLYRSTDFGQNWVVVVASISSNYYSGIVTSTTGQNVTVVVSASLYQSTNFGVCCCCCYCYLKCYSNFFYYYDYYFYYIIIIIIIGSTIIFLIVFVILVVIVVLLLLSGYLCEILSPHL